MTIIGASNYHGMIIGCCDLSNRYC